MYIPWHTVTHTDHSKTQRPGGRGTVLVLCIAYLAFVGRQRLRSAICADLQLDRAQADYVLVGHGTLYPHFTPTPRNG